MTAAPSAPGRAPSDAAILGLDPARMAQWRAHGRHRWHVEHCPACRDGGHCDWEITLSRLAEIADAGVYGWPDDERRAAGVAG
jgi:hypothetical protein